MRTSIEDIKPEIISGMLACAKVKHQFTDTGWKQLHRLVATIEGTSVIPAVTVEGGWTSYDNPAILSVEEIAHACGMMTDDAPTDVPATRGFLGFSEYWIDQMPRIVRFGDEAVSAYDSETVDWDQVKPEVDADVHEDEIERAPLRATKPTQPHLIADDSDGGTPD